MIVFVVEQWSDKRKAWLPTGNVRRTRKAAGEVLLLLNKNAPGTDRQIQPYERKAEKKR